jgi:hypothetical protein
MAGPLDIDGLVLGPCMDAFGEPVTYTPKGGSAFALTGVFDRQYLALDLLDEQSGVATRKPVLGVRAADFPAGVQPLQSDQVTVPSVGLTYVVRTVKPDGHGHVLLELNAAAATAPTTTPGLDFSQASNSMNVPALAA